MSNGCAVVEPVTQTLWRVWWADGTYSECRPGEVVMVVALG